MSELNIVPVLLGADLNCYNMARAFHEEYGVKSYAFGKYAIGATEYTRIIDFRTLDWGEDEGELERALMCFADERKRLVDASLILIGCTDEYAAFISKHRASLGEQYIIPYIPYELMEELTLKEHFYELCEKYGIPYPKTVIYGKGDTLDGLPFGYPIIIKPSSSVLYWKHPFEGMKKVYRAHDRAEAEQIIDAVYSGGYPEKLIIQDTIPGDDSHMYVLTSYSDSTGKVRMMCLGHVLLEEHTPKGLGNHAAIITEKNVGLMERFRDFLEREHFVGYSNFDIKYDSRDGSMRAFEINTRQGRSNYYVTAAGNNTAKYLVEDYVLNKRFEGCLMSENEVYWRYVPDKVVLGYLSPELCERVKRLLREGKAYSSMRYKYDLRFNPRRRLFVFLHERNHIKKFRRYYKIQEQG